MLKILFNKNKNFTWVVGNPDFTRRVSPLRGLVTWKLPNMKPQLKNCISSAYFLH